MGDSDWRALLDAHDAVVRAQLARHRGREVNTSGDGFLATFDGPQRAIRCAMSIRDAVQRWASKSEPGSIPANANSGVTTLAASRCTSVHACAASPGRAKSSSPARCVDDVGEEDG
jgi:class 3 adenylate cyclase